MTQPAIPITHLTIAIIAFFYIMPFKHSNEAQAGEISLDSTKAPDETFLTREPEADFSAHRSAAQIDNRADVAPKSNVEQSHPKKDAGARKILYYRNPMGLADISTTPKQDSMGMDYIPVYEDAESSDKGASLKLDSGKIERADVRTDMVRYRNLSNQLRAIGTIKFDESRLESVTLPVDGYIDELYVSHIGQAVRAGEVLVRILSQNGALLDAEIARRSPAGDTTIQNILTGKRSASSGRWPSPINGVIVDKRVFKGQYVNIGTEMFRIADTTKMWAVVELRPHEAGLISMNARAELRVASIPGKAFDATVLYVEPIFSSESRVARVGIEVANNDGLLKAGMIAEVRLSLSQSSGEMLAVPDNAIVDDGEKKYVFVSNGGGRFEPRTVETGVRADGYVQIIGGVSDGEYVVSSGVFLIDSEANLNGALKRLSHGLVQN
jgi:Cu(I)/Ag(I) efflux system membrane fusion protein